MHTRLRADNPYGCNRYGFAWHYVPKGGAAHLDFGCGGADFLAAIRGKDIGRLTGVDAGCEAIEKSRRQLPQAEFVRVSESEHLPFEDGEFSSVTALDVIEHVADQNHVLSELNRVLRSGGVLIITVPGRHLFSFLDAGNLKFRFPRLHRWYYCRKHCRAEYERRYERNPDGLVGDISAKKMWHEHFSRRNLRRLVEVSGFRVIEFDGTGYFGRVLKCAGFVFGRFGVLKRLLGGLNSLDSRRFESANIFCAAVKEREAGTDKDGRGL